MGLRRCNIVLNFKPAFYYFQEGAKNNNKHLPALGSWQREHAQRFSHLNFKSQLDASKAGMRTLWCVAILFCIWRFHSDKFKYFVLIKSWFIVKIDQKLLYSNQNDLLLPPQPSLALLTFIFSFKEKCDLLPVVVWASVVISQHIFPPVLFHSLFPAHQDLHYNIPSLSCMHFL